MAELQSISDHDRAAWLREDLQREYYAILEVVSNFDQRVMTIKGWSVTLSLAALGLGFQQGHYALFALGSVTALSFWFIEAATKQQQTRYYPRMRDIELAAHNINHLELNYIDPRHEFRVPLGNVSSPRIDMYWTYPWKQKKEDWRTDPPWRRPSDEIPKMLRRVYRRPHVMLPHVVAVVLGLLLFAGAVANVNGLDGLQP